MKTKKRKSDAGKPSYQPSAQEQTAIRKYLDRKAAETAPRMKVLNDGENPRISPDHPEEAIGHVLLIEALGGADQDFVNALLGQLANAGSQGGQIDERGLNFMLSVVKGIHPKDQVEAMLAAQMAAIHMATMTFARRLQHVNNIPQQDSAERAFNKLARTFATQMEALKRYRTGGEQKVTVQHVSVQEGGQAIVGNVTQSPREPAPQKAAPSRPALTDARIAPMPIIGEDEERVPIPAQRRSSK
jgi:hypothetical protein